MVTQTGDPNNKSKPAYRKYCSYCHLIILKKIEMTIQILIPQIMIVVNIIKITTMIDTETMIDIVAIVEIIF